MTKSRFIIVDHLARKAGKHQDLRFQLPDSELWMSFACRKGIPLESGKRVLVIRTPNHSEEDALFLGKLDSGYGAGTFTKFDDGPCDIIKLTPRHIVLNFHGKKVKGIYHLLSIKKFVSKEGKGSEYMIFKGKTNII